MVSGSEDRQVAQSGSSLSASVLRSLGIAV
jgi:hypothetical protein